MPELILAEESAEATVGSSSNVEVDGGLLSPVLVGQNQQPERPQCAPPCCSATRAAVVSDVGLHGLGQCFWA